MASDTNMDGLIDDEGNLLGLVNVVDALVLLLVLAVLVAGVGLVFGIGNSGTTAETGTTFVTMDLGTQPDYIVSALNEGDTYAPTDASNLTITDVYLAPQGDQTRVVARARLTGPTNNETIDYVEAPPRLGRTLDISTGAYNVTGQISEVGDGASLDTSTTTVVLRQTVSADSANAVTPGDEITVGGRTTATIEDVAVYPTSNADQRVVLVEANVSSYTQQGTRRFGGTPLRPGQELTLPAADYTINGRIDAVDTTLQSRDLTNRTVTLELTNVSEATASAIRPGQTEQAGTAPTAYVTGVETEPTPIISTAENGSIVVNDHPRLRDVTLTTELRVSETPSGILFRGERLQYGSTVVLDLGPVTVQAEVTTIGQ